MLANFQYHIKNLNEKHKSLNCDSLLITIFVPNFMHTQAQTSPNVWQALNNITKVDIQVIKNLVYQKSP
jgi:hypothetical protein